VNLFLPLCSVQCQRVSWSVTLGGKGGGGNEGPCAIFKLGGGLQTVKALEGGRPGSLLLCADREATLQGGASGYGEGSVYGQQSAYGSQAATAGQKRTNPYQQVSRMLHLQHCISLIYQRGG